MAGGHGLDFHIRGEVASSMRGRLSTVLCDGKQRLTVELMAISEQLDWLRISMSD